ncbi:hypothetical protein GCM10010193_70890 [Kitasatospora atroaurantiaca]|uniref:hypothetical protein n=1 Tax=Kitasatospora atroaurantiaca TaxID=285545 RepID=UPI001FE4FDCE|nr:hypothetical protein [Kitasatospora atroaurantiaca]
MARDWPIGGITTGEQLDDETTRLHSGRQRRLCAIASSSGRAVTADPWEEVEAAIEDLRDALARIDVTLPGLVIDVPSVMAGHPLVNLGSANATVVKKIAAAVRGSSM